MTSKTTNPQAQADKIEKEYTSAVALVGERVREHSDAVDRATEILESFEMGNDSTYTADDLASAEAAERATEALLKAARTSVDRLNRQRVNTDLRAAEALAPLVAEAFRGRAPVEVRLGKAPRTTEDESLPGLVLTQAEPTTDNGGVLSADEVVVSYVRDNLHAPLYGDRLERVTDAHGFQVAAISSSPGTGSDAVIDSVRLKIHKAWESAPLLVDDPTETAANTWAASVLRTATGAMPIDKGTGNVSETVTYSRHSVDRVSVESKTTDTERTTTVKITGTIKPSRMVSLPSRATIPGLIRDAVTRHDGTAVPGLGRITDLDVRVDTEGGGRSVGFSVTDHRKIEVTATLTSRTE